MGNRLARCAAEFPRLVWDLQPGGGRWRGCDPCLRGQEVGGLPPHPPFDKPGACGFAWAAIKQWSATETSMALSSGEAEYISCVRAASERCDEQALARDFGSMHPAIVHAGSHAAKGVASRSGAGRIRHIESRHLRVQTALKNGHINSSGRLGETPSRGGDGCAAWACRGTLIR